MAVKKPAPPAPYVYEEFPKWKYHPSRPARIVRDAIEEAALGEGWYDSPREAEIGRQNAPADPEPEASESAKPRKKRGS